MFSILNVFKKLLFWSYGRNTWQYDVLCVLILAFVFLTPKSWFENSELRFKQAHQNSLIGTSKLLISADGLSDNKSAQEIERRARAVSGRSNVLVKSWRELRDESGRIVAFEVDIE